MVSGNYIDHPGFITAIKRGIAYITIIQTSACSTCAVKGSCGVSDSEQKQFEIPVQNDQWHVGDEVTVRLKPSTGLLAIFLGYLFPFIVVVATLLILLDAGFSEGTAGVISLMILLPYYGSLACLKNFLRKKMDLKILKR